MSAPGEGPSGQAAPIGYRNKLKILDTREPASMEPTAERHDLESLIRLVERLRAPGGCPWDQKQTLRDVRAYLLEEAHETAAAIDGGDWGELAAELGDLLFQAAFIVRLAEEAGAFGLAEAIAGTARKMIDRHPHVFGPQAGQQPELATAEGVREAWERRKIAQGRQESLLAGVARSLPSLVAAYRMTQKAAGVGFDWPTTDGVLAKIDEELAELRAAIAGGGLAEAAEEVGDLLFSVVNLARQLEVDPEAALARTNLKFRRRFAAVEAALAAAGRTLNDASLAEMDALWERAKATEREAATGEGPTRGPI